MSREAAIKKTFWIFAVFFSALLLLIFCFEAAGYLSPRAMAILVLILAIIGGVTLSNRFSRINQEHQSDAHNSVESSDQTSRRKILKSIRIFRLVLICLPLLLVVGLWQERGNPVFLDLSGVLANLGFTWVFWRALRTSQSKLKQLDCGLLDSGGESIVPSQGKQQ